MLNDYSHRLGVLQENFEARVSMKNEPCFSDSGWFRRYRRPVLTHEHIPLDWRYDLNPETNPHLLERLGVNAVFNTGALFWKDQVILVPRIEGHDRKSFFAVARSSSGVDRFVFDSKPLVIGETERPDTNVYDMRLVAHEDGFIYGLFCSERKDPTAPPGDTSSAEAQCGVVRTRDLETWERLPDVKTPSPQQRNVVLHPEFVEGKYALYTRPMDAFIETGSGGGIGWGLCESMDSPVIEKESILDRKVYHTIKESKNGQGPAPIKTAEGWIHVAHGVRNTAAGLRYVLYLFMTDLEDPFRVIASPGGYFLAPMEEERVGDVSNVAFCNGLAELPDGRVLIYYASADTRTHVAETHVELLLDYVKNTPEDPLTSAACVQQRIGLIERNKS